MEILRELALVKNIENDIVFFCEDKISLKDLSERFLNNVMEFRKIDNNKKISNILNSLLVECNYLQEIYGVFINKKGAKLNKYKEIIKKKDKDSTFLEKTIGKSKFLLKELEKVL